MNPTAPHQVLYIPARGIAPSQSNRRISAEQVEKMSRSIGEVGLLQPITVREIPDSPKDGAWYELVMGECRWRGCAALSADFPVAAFVRELDDKTAARIQAVENFQRQDLDVIEAALTIQHLKDTGWKMAEICGFIGRESTAVYRSLKLLELSDPAREALRKGELAVDVGEMLARIPAPLREEALEAVLEPRLSSKPLTKREALALLTREYIEPEAKAQEWLERRRAVEDNHPCAKWAPYPEARAIADYSSGYVDTEWPPESRWLSDAARIEELVVPKWGELARKHGAALRIGCDHAGDARCYVLAAPLVAAEKAACTDNPQDCIFIHEGAVAHARAAAATRKQQEEEHQAALEREKRKIVDAILDPTELDLAAAGLLVELSYREVLEQHVTWEDVAAALELAADASEIDASHALTRYLRSFESPFEAAGCLRLAAWVMGESAKATAGCLFDSGAISAADYPAYHRVYEQMSARRRAAAPANTSEM